MPGNVLSGDQLAWALVAENEPGTICQQADVKYDFVANSEEFENCFTYSPNGLVEPGLTRRLL